MTSSTGPGERVLGSLRSADGTGIVRIEDRYDTEIGDLWSALTDPRRLARWNGQIDGDLRPGGQFTGALTTKGVDEAYREVIEATLTADGSQTILVTATQGMPLDLVAAYGVGYQIHAENLAAPPGRARARRQQDTVGAADPLPDATEARVLAAGASKYDFQPNDHCRVYADPAGHPFRLSTFHVVQDQG